MDVCRRSFETAMTFRITNNVFGCDKYRFQCLWREIMLTNHLNTRKIKFKKYKKESENHNVEFKTENLDYVKRLRAF
jgi:hypothetical protein